MKSILIRWSAVTAHVLALMAVTTSLSLAQAPEGGRRPEGGRGGFMRNIPVVAAIDADGDGTVSAEEIEGATKALKALDKNGDGKLSEDETRPSFGGGPGGGGPGGFGGGFGGSPEAMVNRVMENDKNKDGKLTKDELPERMQGLFDRADADKDGVVTKDELTKSIPQGGGFGGGSGGGPGGPGGRGPGGPGGPGGFGNPTAFIDRMFEFDADKDGKLSREELTKMMEQGRGPGGREGGNRRPATE